MMRATMLMLMMAMMTARVEGFRGMREVTGPGMQIVSVGQGGVWAVTPKNYIYYRNNTYNTDGVNGTEWLRVSGGLKQLEVGNDVVWGVNRKDMIYIRRGITPSNPVGSKWQRISGALNHVTVSPAGNTWGVKGTNQIYRRRGVTEANPAGKSWKRISGSLKQISSGTSGVWGVDSNNQVYYREGTFGDIQSEGTHWTNVPDMKMKYLSSAFGNVFAISKAGDMYIRRGMTFSRPTGKHWRRLRRRDTDLLEVDSLSGYFWAIKKENTVWYGHLSTRC